MEKTAMFSRSHVNKGERDKALEDEIKALETVKDDEEEQHQEEQKAAPEKEEKLSPEESTFKKRYGDLRRLSQQKEDDYKRRIEALEEKINKAPANKVMPKTEEEVEAWVKEYPDIAGIVLGLVKGNTQDRSTELDERMKRIEEAEQRVAADRAEAKLRELHPDIEELRNSDAFHEWAEEQPRWVQVALYEDDEPRAAARAIDLYKADKGIKTKVKQSPERSAAEGVKPQGRTEIRDDGYNGRVFKESVINKMSAKEYEKNEEAIMEAIRAGRFEYDVSGAAR